MNNPIPEDPPEAPPVANPQNDSRRRLRELLSIPERDRTDPQWDEIIELEIQLAPGNRATLGDAGGGHNPGRGPGGAGKPGAGSQQKKHRPRAGNNRRGRQNKPPSGGGTPA